jgi:cytochrome c
VYKKTFAKLVLLPFGIALLLAGLFFQLGAADAVQPQTTPVPTQDRLAEPTLPASPLQADYGAQVYWLYCSPCHGDKAQGLTDEFRQQYPPEDQNCWKSHCHGKVTYENGFTIPTLVPQLVGPGSLAKFPTAANLYGFIHAAMPFQKPNSLTDEQYYQITAFLLRQNGLIDKQTEVTGSNLATIIVSHATPVPTPQQSEIQKSDGRTGWLILIGIISMLVILAFVLKNFRNPTKI